MDRLIAFVTLDSKVVHKRNLDQDKVTIGREPDNDICINNLAVSRHHAEITLDGGKYFIKDLASANGVFLNGSKTSYSELSPGDIVNIGKYALRIQSHSPAIDIAHSEGNTVVVDRATRDKFLKKGDSSNHGHTYGGDDSRLLLSDQGEVFINRDYFTIGNDISADLRIKGWLVRKKHATIIKRNDESHSIISSGSLFCPTRVNGSRIDETTLTTGDVIQIGNNEFIYVR